MLGRGTWEVGSLNWAYEAQVFYAVDSTQCGPSNNFKYLIILYLNECVHDKFEKFWDKAAAVVGVF